jgi:hypothetical protein
MQKSLGHYSPTKYNGFGATKSANSKKLKKGRKAI